MNKDLEDFARAQLQDNLQQLPENQQRIFKLMYGRNNGKRSVEDTEKMSIDEVVAEMPVNSLDWAMQQVHNTMANNAIAAVE